LKGHNFKMDEVGIAKMIVIAGGKVAINCLLVSRPHVRDSEGLAHQKRAVRINRNVAVIGKNLPGSGGWSDLLRKQHGGGVRGEDGEERKGQGQGAFDHLNNTYYSIGVYVINYVDPSLDETAAGARSPW